MSKYTESCLVCDQEIVFIDRSVVFRDNVFNRLVDGRPYVDEFLSGYVHTKCESNLRFLDCCDGIPKYILPQDLEKISSQLHFCASCDDLRCMPCYQEHTANSDSDSD